MKIKKLLPAVAVVVVVPLVSFWAASGRSSTPETPSARSDNPPVYLEPVPGTDVYRVVLSEPAAERVGISTAPIRTLERSRASEVAAGPNAAAASERGEPRVVIPYSAVLYDAQGDTWVYTNTEPLAFVRHRVSIESIDGDDAVLSNGPPLGTMVVVVGGAELFGAELSGPEFEVDQ